MTYDKASNSYVTDDGYILPVGPKIERLSGYMLQDELDALPKRKQRLTKAAQAIEAQVKSTR